jgi:HK97 gp10 family phage protein
MDFGQAKLMAQLKRIENIDIVEPTVPALEVILEESQSRTPVLTGNLRDSQHIEKTANGSELVIDADYAFFVEFGTSTMSAQPFIRPAIDVAQRKALQEAAKVVQKEIKEAV